MTDSYQDIDDGIGRYGSRVRVNRRVLTLTADSSNSISGSLDLNGKIARVVLDISRLTCGANAANTGSLKITMDIQDQNGDEYPYCDTIAGFSVETSITAPYHFQTAEGGNRGTTSSNCGLHFTVTAPSASTTGGLTINEPAPWNGLVCGKVRFTLVTSNSTFSAGNARIILLHE